VLWEDAAALWGGGSPSHEVAGGLGETNRGALMTEGDGTEAGSPRRNGGMGDVQNDQATVG